MLPSLVRFHFFFLWSGQCMFGCERCKAHLERFSRVRSAGLATALSKIIPFDRRSVVHETFPPVGQSSSGVEQRTHKPLVGGSNPSSGTTRFSLEISKNLIKPTRSALQLVYTRTAKRCKQMKLFATR